MEKSIVVTVRPERAYLMLSGCTEYEVRNMFPKNFTGDAYIYVTEGCGKDSIYAFSKRKNKVLVKTANSKYKLINKNILKDIDYEYVLNGKVVGVLKVDEVESIEEEKQMFEGRIFKIQSDEHEYVDNDILFMDNENLANYVTGDSAYLFHFYDVEKFDKPINLSDLGVKNAPKNYCYVSTLSNKVPTTLM